MKEKTKWYKSWSNWGMIIACIILVSVLILNLYVMFQAKTNEDKVPSVFGYKPFIVLSGSMETKIHKGDLILTKIVNPETLKVDDIIAFRDSENTVTTHRIVDIVVEDGITYFITKGDQNNTQDRNLVEFDDVEGIYIARIPSLGAMMDKLSEPGTIVVVIVGVTAIFVIGFLMSSKKQQDLERKELLEFRKQFIDKQEKQEEKTAGEVKSTDEDKKEEDNEKTSEDE